MFFWLHKKFPCFQKSKILFCFTGNAFANILYSTFHGPTLNKIKRKYMVHSNILYSTLHGPTLNKIKRKDMVHSNIL